jgi:hypothetical protein
MLSVLREHGVGTRFLRLTEYREHATQNSANRDMIPSLILRRLFPSATRLGSREFHESSAARTLRIADCRVNGGVFRAAGLGDGDVVIGHFVVLSQGPGPLGAIAVT